MGICMGMRVIFVSKYVILMNLSFKNYGVACGHVLFISGVEFSLFFFNQCNYDFFFLNFDFKD